MDVDLIGPKEGPDLTTPQGAPILKSRSMPRANVLSPPLGALALSLV